MARSIYIFNTHELPHRAGEMREYQLDLKIVEPVGVDLLSVKPGEVIAVDLRLQSVNEGVLATARVMATATGECTRCLKPITWPVDENFTELYYYELAAGKRGTKSKSGKDEDDLSFMVGDDIDLEPAIRDAIILNLAVNPICAEDCPGIADKEGQSWAFLPAEQSQTPVDQRWAALKDFPLKN
jgi:uncharacterized protein